MALDELFLSSLNLPAKKWQEVLPFALHSVRSLLCTATNCTPHERMFQYNRKGSWGVGLPAWLCKPGQILMRRNVRASKYEPLVDVVELLEANTRYAHVKLPNGKESTVALRHLAPAGEVNGNDLDVASGNLDASGMFDDTDNEDSELLGFDSQLNPVESKVDADSAAAQDHDMDTSDHSANDVNDIDNVSTPNGTPSQGNEAPRRSARQRAAPERFVPLTLQQG